MRLLVTLDVRKNTEWYRDCGEFGLTHRIVSKPVCGRLVLACAMALLSPLALALSLGAEQVTSALGQPLRMTVPLLGAITESLDARCFRVVTPSRTDGLSVVNQARIEVQSTSTPPQLIIRGVRAVDEPIVRISIEAGCEATIRRDYTLFLDPPTVQQPEIRQASASPAPPVPVMPDRAQSLPQATAVPAPGAGATVARQTVGDRRDAAAATRKKSTSRNRTIPAEALSPKANAAPAMAAVTSQSVQQDRLKVQAGSPDAPNRVEDAALAALAVPRLRVSSDLVMLEPGNQPGGAAVDELQLAIAKDRRARLRAAPIEQDLAPRLEADLVVAQRRLAELQLQLSNADMAEKSAGSAAAPKTKGVDAPSSVAGTGWNWVSWMWIPGLLLVAGLLVFLLRQRRTQKAVKFSADSTDAENYTLDEEITVVLPTQRRTSDRGQPGVSTLVPSATASVETVSAAAGAASVMTSAETRIPVVAGRAEREASDRLNHPLFQLRDTESHVDVTELSQVTEEAQVYADLGRNDQAIELLRDHIDIQSGDRSSPAPWLMIFELYRRTNNRAGYDELAPQFRKHFNGRVPDWDNYGHELALDDGLEAFPHLVARIERDWGTADARKFLEELLYDNRGGSRLGFSLAAYRDILLLLQVHEGLSSQPEFSSNDRESRGADNSDGTPKWDLSLEMIEPPKTGELESFFNRPPPDKS